MSYVTNVIFSFSLHEAKVEGWDSDSDYVVMQTINAWLIDEGFGPFGQGAEQICGGHKSLETPIYVAAFNYFRLDTFLGMLRTLPWREPASVQVFAQDEEANQKFTVIEPCVSLIPSHVT